jgi:hypothetical protein
MTYLDEDAVAQARLHHLITDLRDFAGAPELRDTVIDALSVRHLLPLYADDPTDDGLPPVLDPGCAS